MPNLFHPPMPQQALCGCFVVGELDRKFLPLVDTDAHATVLSTSSRTTLTQTFINPDRKQRLDDVCYSFPLYDGVTVVSFACTVGGRKIKGVVKERRTARRTYEDATRRGETAALLEQSVYASDVFTASIGNVSAGHKVKIEIIYLGELEHDAEVDAVRLTIPTSIAPRYDGSQVLGTAGTDTALHAASIGGSISITVDAEMADGCCITKIHSPSHPISVDIGKTSKATSKLPSLQRASATLALGTSSLGKDFVIMIAADGLCSPTAILETHPDSQRRALMTTLVPRFSLPISKPEVVFVCDRSGSMSGGSKIPDLTAALQLFLKSLPVGVKFNICSFGSRFTFLWKKSQIYDQASLDKAVQHVKSFEANYGGTKIYEPLEETFKRRLADMNLEVFLLTDGETWEQDRLFTMIDNYVAESAGAIRVFSLGVGDEASSALIGGVARAGNGFAQKVAENEKMDKKVIRMLKGALTPHIKDYALEIKYQEPKGGEGPASDDDFEVVEAVACLSTGIEQDDATTAKFAGAASPKKPISLFDPEVREEELEMARAPTGDNTDPGKLPDIALPRYLQTPFKIPALFPFNRTTVYVMLSAATPGQEIQSVIFTGTSANGPLRLEVPVTKLAEKGTTIHQLAARKAIQELEENGGWIAHAKISNGNLLSNQFEGRVDRMVQREGARLGVEYQVGGKWCSFVAVEDKETQGDDEAEMVGKFEVVHAKGMDSPRDVFGGPDPRDVRLFSAAPPPPSTPVGSGGGHTRGAWRGGYSRGNARCLKRRRTGPSLGYSDTRATNFDVGYAMTTCASMTAGGLGRASFSAASTSECSAHESNDDDDCDVGFGLCDDGPASLGKEAGVVGSGLRVRGGGHVAHAVEDGEGALDDSDLLTGLASLQTFIGSWKWSAELEKIMGVTQKKAGEMKLPTESVGRTGTLATLCAVVFLRKKMADRMDAWELMVDKAERWLEEETGETAAGLEKMVEEAGLFGAAEGPEADGARSRDGYL